MKRTKFIITLTALLVVVLAGIVMSCVDQKNPAQMSSGGSSGGGAAAPRAVTTAVAMESGAQFDKYPRPKMSKDGKLGIAYLYGTIDQEDDQRMYRQIQIECYNRGWEVHNIEVKTDEQLIRTGWLTAINLGVDAIVIPGMAQLDNKKDLIEQSRNAGIGIYCWDSMALEGLITNFTVPRGVVALELFYNVASDMNWEGDFCITTAYQWPSIWECSVVVKAYLESTNIYPGLRLLDEQSVDFASPIALWEQCYNFMQTWNQKYDKDIDAVFVVADGDSILVNESAVAAGRKPEDLKIFTIGGAQNTVGAMRNPTSCIQYNYATSCEQQAHLTCELVDEIQIKGWTPGDGNCMIDKAGSNSFLTGTIITKNNLPEVGSSMMSIYPWYDENDKDAWYNWSSPEYAEPYVWQ